MVINSNNKQEIKNLSALLPGLGLYLCLFLLHCSCRVKRGLEKCQLYQSLIEVFVFGADLILFSPLINNNVY